MKYTHSFILLCFVLVILSDLNTLRPKQNGRHFADDVFKCIFLNENVWILLKISLKFVPEVPINNIPSLVQIMAWRRPGDKSLSEPMMVSLLTHICVARPQWVNECMRPCYRVTCANRMCIVPIVWLLQYQWSNSVGNVLALNHNKTQQRETHVHTKHDVIQWKHFPRYWLFVRGIHRSPVNSPHKGQWRGALMFSLICAWIDAWVNNREAGDLRAHRAHYDITVIKRPVATRVSCRNKICLVFPR